jgi:hypothetical protein
MEFFDLSSATKDNKPIYDVIKQSVDGQRPKVPGYQLIPKLMAKAPAAKRELYNNYKFEVADFDDLEAGVIPYAAGAEDGTHWFHGPKDKTDVATIATKVTEKVKEFVEGSDDNLEPLYSLLVTGLELPLANSEDNSTYKMPVIGWIFEFTNNLASFVPSLPEDQLERYMKLSLTLAFKSAHKTPVKVGLIMLGLGKFPNTYRDDLIDMAMDLGRHEEFTWYSCRFLYSNINEPMTELWDMAIGSRSWGRIMAIKVCFLVASFMDLPEAFQRWLLARGYKNDVMIDYTAMDCVKFGDLLGALSEDKVEEDILQGAYDILKTIFESSGGPVSLEIDAVPDNEEIIAQYKKHINSTPERKEKYTIEMIDLLYQ